MLLFGHPYLPSETFYHIESLEAIRRTPPNSVLTLFFTPENLDLIEHLRQHGVRFALHVNSITDAVIGENLRASYLIINPKYGNEIQKVADHYLFDAKILGYVKEMDDLEPLIDMRLDGAIFTNAIIKITS